MRRRPPIAPLQFFSFRFMKEKKTLIIRMMIRKSIRVSKGGGGEGKLNLTHILSV